MQRHRIMRESIPEEIVESHILPRLSSKSLVRFTCVCKSWHSLIHHPNPSTFGRPTHHDIVFLSRDSQYLSAATSRPHVLSAPFDPTVQPNATTTPPRATLLFTLPTNLDISETRFQCVNGLPCFHPYSRVSFSSPNLAFTIIVNPTTRQILTLPLDHFLANRVFRVSTHFGYDPVRDEFKVLRVVMYLDNSQSHEFKIFTLGHDRSWRVITPNTVKRSALLCCFLNNYSLMKKGGLCVDGSIHWIYYSFTIVTFDVSTEHFKLLPAPFGYFYGKYILYYLRFPAFVEIDGCLSLIGYNESDFMLWILKDKVWEQKSIVLPSGMARFAFPLCEVSTGKL